MMFFRDRVMLRLHCEAVWGVSIPPLEQGDVSLLPESLAPSWRLWVAEIAAGRLHIWRPDVTPAERERLLDRLEFALAAPLAPLPGVSHEIAFRLTAEPVIEHRASRGLARLLSFADYACVAAFQPESATAYFQPEPAPLIGVIINGRLLSLAHSARRTAEACELGIETLPEVRRRGYALAATLLWSAAVFQEGLVPMYSALAENRASRRLAVAAGYHEYARVTVLE